MADDTPTQPEAPVDNVTEFPTQPTAPASKVEHPKRNPTRRDVLQAIASSYFAAPVAKDGKVMASLQILRDQAKRLAFVMIEVMPGSREGDQAMLHLDQAIMCASAAITRNGLPQDLDAELSPEQLKQLQIVVKEK